MVGKLFVACSHSACIDFYQQGIIAVLDLIVHFYETSLDRAVIEW
jgi:hypothetical protein